MEIIEDRLLNKKTIKKQKLSNGEDISYRELGNSEKILFLIHGTLISSVLFDPLSKLSKDFRIIAIDLRGHGDSSNNNDITTLDDFVQDCILLLKELNIEKIFLLGVSLGAGISMKIAANYPKIVEKMILIGPIKTKGLQFKVWDEKRSHKIVARNLEQLKNCLILSSLNLNLNNKNFYMIEERLKQCFFTKDSQLFNEFINSAMKNVNYIESILAANLFNISADYNGVCIGSKEIFNIQCNTLVIHGECDEINEIKHSEIIVSYIGSKKAKLDILEKFGHIPFLENSNVVIEIIEKFLL